MGCIKCGGEMIGDGYHTVMHCENIDEANDDYEYAAPDEGPFYCGYQELSEAELEEYGYHWMCFLMHQTNQRVIMIHEADGDFND
jgi:hypothetical protein